jgi:glycosyltransferase involved in cell wall biosynthesis
LFRELLASDFTNSYTFFYSDHNRAELDLIGNDRWQEGAIKVEDQGEILRHLLRVDLLFCPFSTLWPRPACVPSVVTMADIQEVFYPQFFSEATLLHRRAHYAGSTRSADSVIAVSEYTKRTIAEHHQISPDKVFVAYHTTDESFFEPVDEEVVAHLRLPERFVLYPANHWLHKNHDGLLRALRYLKHERQVPVPCVLTGFPMADGYPLAEKIAAYGLEEQVRVVGYVSDDEVRGLYRRATLLCFPSLFEGFGMPVVEAMAAGCPVACSTATSIPEVAGDAALYFDPNDPREMGEKILALWEDAGLRERLVADGKERARQFTARRMAEAHLEAFRYARENFFPEIRELYSRLLYTPLEEWQHHAEHWRAQTENLWGRLAQLEKQVEELAPQAVQAREMEASLSWRVTAPLRWLGKKGR